MSNIYQQRAASHNLLPALLRLLTDTSHLANPPCPTHTINPNQQQQMILQQTLTQQLGGLLQQQSCPQTPPYSSHAQVLFQ